MTYGADCGHLRSKICQALAKQRWVAGVVLLGDRLEHGGPELAGLFGVWIAGTAGMTGQEPPVFISTMRTLC